MNEINAIFTIAFRDFIKFLRDRTRIIGSFIFPLIFIGVLGGSMQSNLGANAGFDLLLFSFTGVLAQTIFQSTASGIISLIEDRANDFSQEIFVSPISRYSIIVGKILGETFVSFAQIIGILVFGLIFGIHLSLWQVLMIIPLGLLLSFLGGAFGVMILANLSSQRSANQIFQFIMFPQFFLAGVFVPINELPLPLLILSRIAPLTYAVDFLRSIMYIGDPTYSKVVLFNPLLSLSVILIMSFVFLTVGTILFVRGERNR